MGVRARQSKWLEELFILDHLSNLAHMSYKLLSKYVKEKIDHNLIKTNRVFYIITTSSIFGSYEPVYFLAHMSHNSPPGP